MEARGVSGERDLMDVNPNCFGLLKRFKSVV
jgi:hypothetical protein